MNAFDKITRNAGPVKNKGLVTNMRVMILALLGWFGAVVPISSQQVSKDMLYLHTDRSWYISGDQVYFKSYLLPGKSPASTVAASQSPEGILYVWFLDLHGTEVWKGKFPMDLGTASGDFCIPDSLRTGFYFIVALSICESVVSEEFSREVPVLNPSRSWRNGNPEIKMEAVLADEAAKKAKEGASAETPAMRDTSSCCTIEFPGIRPAYSYREKVDAVLRVRDWNGNPVAGSFSVTVVDSINAVGMSPITGIHYCSSSGIVEIPWDPGIMGGTEVRSLGNEKKLSGLRLTVRLDCHPEVTEAAIPPDMVLNSLVFMIPGQKSEFCSAWLGSSGSVAVDLGRRYGELPIVMQIRDAAPGSKCRIMVLPHEPVLRISPSARITTSSRTMRDYLLFDRLLTVERGISRIRQTYEYYGIDLDPVSSPDQGSSAYASHLTAEDTLPFYGVPDKTIRFDEYESATSFKDLVDKSMYPVKLWRVKRSPQLRFRMVYQETPRFTEPPMLMLNGLLLQGTGNLMTVNPAGLERVDLKYTGFIYNGFHFNGLVAFYTKNSGIWRTWLQEGQQVFLYEGFRRTSLPAFPDYSNKPADPRRPDIRSRLYWNPHINTDSSGTAEFGFYTSDLSGTFIIQVEGVAGDGQPVSGRTIFRVAGPSDR